MAEAALHVEDRKETSELHEEEDDDDDDEEEDEADDFLAMIGVIETVAAAAMVLSADCRLGCRLLDVVMTAAATPPTSPLAHPGLTGLWLFCLLLRALLRTMAGPPPGGDDTSVSRSITSISLFSLVDEPEDEDVAVAVADLPFLLTGLSCIVSPTSPRDLSPTLSGQSLYAAVAAAEWTTLFTDARWCWWW